MRSKNRLYENDMSGEWGVGFEEGTGIDVGVQVVVNIGLRPQFDPTNIKRT